MKKIIVLSTIALMLNSFAYAQNKKQDKMESDNSPSLSLMEEYSEYKEVNNSILQPGSIIDEKDLKPYGQVKIPLNIQILKNNEEVLSSSIDVLNSQYVKIFSGNEVNNLKKDDNALNKIDDKLLEGKKKEINDMLDSIEIGLIVNIKKNNMLSQVWFENESTNLKSKIATIKNQNKLENAELSETPVINRNIKEILIVHKFKTKASAKWSDYKIIITPL